MPVRKQMAPAGVLVQWKNALLLKFFVRNVWKGQKLKRPSSTVAYNGCHCTNSANCSRKVTNM
jgi:hypothetical protein